MFVLCCFNWSTSLLLTSLIPEAQIHRVNFMPQAGDKNYLILGSHNILSTASNEDEENEDEENFGWPGATKEAGSLYSAA